MNARTKLSSKGQLVIPKTVRDAHGWKEGMEFEFVENERGVGVEAEQGDTPVQGTARATFAEAAPRLPGGRPPG